MPGKSKLGSEENKGDNLADMIAIPISEEPSITITKTSIILWDLLEETQMIFSQEEPDKWLYRECKFGDDHNLWYRFYDILVLPYSLQEHILCSINRLTHCTDKVIWKKWYYWKLPYKITTNIFLKCHFCPKYNPGKPSTNFFFLYL